MSATTLDPLQTSFVRSVFLDAPSWNHAAVPAWFAQSQLSAWETFANLPMPGRRDESWRFADLKLLDFDSYTAPADDDGEVPDLENTALLEKTAARLVFVNDRLVSRGISDTSLQVLTLAEALERHGDLLKETLTVPDTGLGGEKFAALHQAQLRDAVVILVPAKAEISDPVEIVHWLGGADSAAFPRTVILTERHAKVTVLEHHLSTGNDAGLSIGAAQLIAGEGSSINYVLLNQRNEADKNIHLSTVRGGRDAQVRHSLINLAAGWTRTECRSLVTGQGSRSEMFSVSLAAGSQEIDQRTLQDHMSPHSYSDLLYKNVLFDTARTIFAGLIKVDDGAHFTDAYQKCRNLLLSESCEANSMPGLEINADQVKCSHGSTSGRIAEDELFYFESRGIPRASAAHLIALGFAQEVVEKVDHPEISALLAGAIAARFDSIHPEG
ncbi:MAG: Fe-S cluster assembly protein SufD [Verrucomicrobiales bacterium]|nr:Fe-S cluster assembly protein SufD [Verrucomicrobiales bacterium]